MKLRYISCLLAVLAFTGCERAAETQLSGSIQGTTYHIKMVMDKLEVTPEQVKADVEAVFKLVDEKLSNWREDSEISRINQQKTSDWISVSPEIVQLVTIAKDIHQRSQGCYDLTVKPLFDLWGFSKHESRVPEQGEIDRILAHVGMEKLEVDAENGRIRKQDPELAIDLSSIAQGYTVGAVADRLESRGIRNYLAEIGGEMKVKGRKANGAQWRVAIEKPTPLVREVQRILDIHQESGTAVMTSGTYRNFFESGGQSYSHILNPKTGRPVTHNLLSVTVLHNDPTLADAWSTALLCVGEIEGAKIAEAEGLKALFIYRDGQELKERMSSQFLSAPAP
ncbi:FAD:protein FMN transferase [Methylocaldum sp.]|uniref:FAD:protein FMN transferase n=1 Tax=Methylocaldum sp. TaxID=1969727 RepID=UPI002D67E725|nr:FAD:protein FMN transferase [Methylocaldum sp.]HYE34651.1 FAD:protein FMN transferase [Methylocaldum sp.]